MRHVLTLAIGSAQIGGFLEQFQNVATTTSLQNTLSSFEFRTSQSWSPNYSSLLVFKQTQVLEIQFSCHNGCSSTADDDTVTNLARGSWKSFDKAEHHVVPSPASPLLVTAPISLGLRIHVQAKELGAATGIEPPRPCVVSAALMFRHSELFPFDMFVSICHFRPSRYFVSPRLFSPRAFLSCSRGVLFCSLFSYLALTIMKHSLI